MSTFQVAKCLAKLSKLSSNHSKVLVTSVRNHWNKDHKPGPYPKTESERLAAAKKYGVHPAEYEAYDDDGTGYGDYPKFKAESGDSKDPFYPWDYPELKRNFEEPLHVEFDLIREDRYDVTTKYTPSCKIQYLQFIGVMSGLYLMFWICEHFKCFHAAIPKQYPSDGKTHYTFD
ncbi:hypothetical protein HHI36_016249 [Cryptolaemus montrouzieri]|uniref:NADH dehydrogenase [ubiquinone] 1 beta subcomplex subunit 8, mitochondrial n=1 Tax=Cryptolaemus montrouzieri TaxID=559131 RepID=A0ABD2NJV6_9CUCU